jgi:hypothetical protein
MQAFVMMQEAGRAFIYGEASNEIVADERLKYESGVDTNEARVCRELEELKDFAARAYVGKRAPRDTRNPSRRPRFPFSRQSQQRPKKPAIISRQSTVIRCQCAIETHCHLAANLSDADVV